ncbi:glycosyl transferase [Pseudoxanthomonas broegbernensis]|uniref:Glycosyl transferase n=1 Tax=Pseudoxanthomonas broegbernensis TaxID=83619 RepID=A0A7V8GPQ3_9GAMM|nr:glycosyltransferase family 4 protein [Pseudoxanthomonas broegbernensis]KAF1687925.1 glycosyl transferase [Pseudoxanthomonas broegbernensis]MBB6064929.1 UDP-N-acetylmuramyl pentapeptide phosphotransferase/UDP-N-acetylglucosamine-1-phosphate transferase [Pseudoxanthomonas broegbernensis]
MPASAWPLLALWAAAALGTWATLRYARRRRLIDLPGERRSHAVPTPRGGGLGIASALLLGCAWATAAGMVAPVAALAFAAGLVLVAGIGWVDDHRPLSPALRLLVQCLAGAVLALGLFGADGCRGWALLAFAAVPVLVNVWNFMDGIDGLATTQALICACVLALLAPAQAGLPGWALAAACCGFLPFNFPKARIFLGDVGSGALGYALAAIAVAAAARTGRIDGATPVVLLPLSAFLVDASMTLGGRILAGERWWLPHVSHLYQRWVRAGRSHVAVTLVYASFSLMAGILALALNQAEPWLAGGVAVLWLLLAAITWLLLRRTATH